MGDRERGQGVAEGEMGEALIKVVCRVNEPVVGITVFRDELYVATRWAVYKLVDDELIPVAVTKEESP